MSTRPFVELCSPALMTAALALLFACDGSAPGAASAPTDARGLQEIEEKLHGTWLREYTAQGIRARRILVLEPDGTFQEVVRLVDPAGGQSEQLHAGTWLYDGTNLKRKYTVMNGQPPSRLNLPFATFQIRFESRNEFIGIDHIHRNRVDYRRVSPGTQP